MESKRVLTILSHGELIVDFEVRQTRINFFNEWRNVISDWHYYEGWNYMTFMQKLRARKFFPYCV